MTASDQPRSHYFVIEKKSSGQRPALFWTKSYNVSYWTADWNTVSRFDTEDAAVEETKKIVGVSWKIVRVVDRWSMGQDVARAAQRLQTEVSSSTPPITRHSFGGYDESLESDR